MEHHFGTGNFPYTEVPIICRVIALTQAKAHENISDPWKDLREKWRS